jgi:hypothetical protein
MNLLWKVVHTQAFRSAFGNSFLSSFGNSVLLSFSADDEHDAAPIARTLTLNRPAWSAGDY